MRYYDIQSHPQGLGYIAIEYRNPARTKKTGWQSQNHCRQELCETEINLRKAFIRKKEEQSK